MRALLGVIVAVALLWGGYWFWGADQVRKQTQVWMSEQGATGAVSVIGFPNRFDLTVTDPAVQRDGIGYSAAFFQVFAMTWKPWHVIAAFAPSQEITLLDQKLTLSSPQLLASLLMNPTDGFSFRELRLDGTKIGLASSKNWHIDAAHVTAAIDASSDPMFPRIGGRLKDFTTPVPVAGFTDIIALASFDANLRLQSPIVATTASQSILAIDLRDARLNWGRFHLTAKGSLAPDMLGRISGDLTVSLQGADQLPQILVALGLIAPDQTANLTKGLAALGESGEITLPLSLSGGVMRIGPFPLGQAPLWPL